MRFFRIPAFTGIETHRDDMDRGSLRTVEGCVPHGPGGLRSGPVWSKIGSVDQLSTGPENHASAADDGRGNSLLFVSRESEVHDLLVMSTENTALVSLGASYSVIDQSVYDQEDATLTPVGNRLYALGDGSEEAVTVGKGPPDIEHIVFPDETLYNQEWSRFPNCQFYVSGPKKTIFAAGNPGDPLVVYISEPAGMSQPIRDNPYSTHETSNFAGMLSEVRILGSNASKITALSTRGDKVVVHTDKGCHILYAPSSDQASTGYRTEQVAATNTSAAVNSQTVSGDGGTQPFWLGHDGQIYKDEAAVRGAEDFKAYADPQQASWKAKGKWEKEHPSNLANSFATYDAQSGMYWVFIESSDSPLNTRKPSDGPTFLSASIPLPGTGPEDLTLNTSPASGPSYLDLVQPPPSTGPEDLALQTTPVSGPTSLDLVQPPPSTGPKNLALQTAPATGPTSLDLQTAPANGPTGLSTNQQVFAPTSGPTSLSANQQVFAPTSGPTGLNATQAVTAPSAGPTALTATQASTAITCSNLSGLATTSGAHHVYLTQTIQSAVGNASNWSFKSLQNVSTPTTQSEMNSTGGSGNTCNQKMTSYFPNGGISKFEANNGFCDVYTHWVKATYAGLRDVDSYINGNGWAVGTGIHSWSVQQITPGGQSYTWYIAGNTNGAYKVIRSVASLTGPIDWFSNGFDKIAGSAFGTCEPFGAFQQGNNTSAHNYIIKAYVAAHPQNNSWTTDGVFGDAGYAWDGTSFQLDSWTATQSPF